MIHDFKKFIMRGNVIDLGVAVIIGAAFNKIISSFVNDMLMPPIGILLGNVDFTELKYVLKNATETTQAVSIQYGLFIQTIVDFLIIAMSVFIVVKVYEKMQKKESMAPTPPSKQEVLLEEIRDILKK